MSELLTLMMSSLIETVPAFTGVGMEIRKFECPGSMKPPVRGAKWLCSVCHKYMGLTLIGVVASHIITQTWLTPERNGEDVMATDPASWCGQPLPDDRDGWYTRAMAFKESAEEAERERDAAAAARADLAAKVSRLREALAWYADETNYDAVERHTEPPPMRRVGRNIVAVGPGPIFWESSNAEEDRGTRARAALG
jgi:hypothetical protein